MSYKLEYIWLDGYTPEPSMRSKTKIIGSEPTSIADCPQWSFDGSSTEQAEGSSSDCLLQPVRMVLDPTRKNAFLVMCEVCGWLVAHVQHTRRWGGRRRVVAGI